MEILGVLIIVIGVVVSVGRRSQQEDPLDRPVTVATRRGPNINQKVKDLEWAIAYVRGVATSGTDPLTDSDVRQMYSEIVINDELTSQAKYYLLDGLYQRTMNDHPQRMAADVLEEISNESIALDHPEWHGRHGDWHSVVDR